MQIFAKLLLDLVDLPGLVRNLFSHRELISLLTWRDFRARYRGSFGGLFWSFFQPLVMMTIYTLVFSSFLKIKFGSSDSPFSFSVYLLCGLLPWTAFSESFSFSTALIGTNSNLVKRVVFPLEILPLATVLTNTIQLTIGLLLLLPLAALVGGRLSWSVLSIPLILLLQVLFYSGLTWVWASLSVYIPDLRQLTSLMLVVVMFMTPIFYPIEIVPAWAIPWMRLNPFALLVTMYRSAIIEGAFPALYQFFWLLAVSLISFMAGYFWFMKTKNGFADVL